MLSKRDHEHLTWIYNHIINKLEKHANIQYMIKFKNILSRIERFLESGIDELKQVDDVLIFTTKQILKKEVLDIIESKLKFIFGEDKKILILDGGFKIYQPPIINIKLDHEKIEKMTFDKLHTKRPHLSTFISKYLEICVDEFNRQLKENFYKEGEKDNGNIQKG